MAHARLAGDPARAEHPQRFRRGHRGREDLGANAFGAGETPEPFHAAQGGFVGCAFVDRDPAVGDPGDDPVERLVIVDLPAEGGHILGGAALDQESARPVVEPETHRVGVEPVDVHADRRGPEAIPVGQSLGLHRDVAQVHRSEHRAVGVRA